MGVARFRFYEELNDFLAPERRGGEFEAPFARAATVKNAIESLGVPHTEVELVLVDGRSVDFSHRMQDGERVSVYPMFEALDITPLLRVRPAPMREPRFIADAHLGGLARLLRMLGFDTLYDNGYTDEEIRCLASEEHRIVLTRDRALLVSRSVTHGCYVHARRPAAQLQEIVRRLDLGARMRPFTLCLHCNLALRPVDKAEVIERLPTAVAERHEQFTFCADCRRVYWEGSHWERMRALLRDSLAPGYWAAEPPGSGRTTPGASGISSTTTARST